MSHGEPQIFGSPALQVLIRSYFEKENLFEGQKQLQNIKGILNQCDSISHVPI